MPRDDRGDGGEWPPRPRRWIGTYILEGHQPVPAPTLQWAMWLETHSRERKVALSVVHQVKVSTVFLGLDQGYGQGRPILFETMVFGGGMDGAQWRYATWKGAENGHREACAEVKRAKRKPSAALAHARMAAELRAWRESRTTAGDGK